MFISHKSHLENKQIFIIFCMCFGLCSVKKHICRFLFQILLARELLDVTLLEMQLFLNATVLALEHEASHEYDYNNQIMHDCC